MNDELIALCNAHQQNPLAIVYKGMIAMNAKKYEEAIADFSSITPDHPSYLQVVFNRAVCKLNVAGDFQDKHANKNTGAMTPADDAKLKELLNDAKVDFEIARQLDPEQKTVRWAVLLRNIYYNLGEEEKYKELEFM
jgi:tetratricopeptide (TPR) repeat protein